MLIVTPACAGMHTPCTRIQTLCHTHIHTHPQIYHAHTTHTYMHTSQHTYPKHTCTSHAHIPCTHMNVHTHAYAMHTHAYMNTHMPCTHTLNTQEYTMHTHDAHAMHTPMNTQEYAMHTYHAHTNAHTYICHAHTHHEHTCICHAYTTCTHAYAMHTHHEHTFICYAHTSCTHMHVLLQLHMASAVPPLTVPTLFMVFSKHIEDSQGPGDKCWGHSAVPGGQSVRKPKLKPSCPYSPNGSHCEVPHPGYIFLVVTWLGHSCWA